MSSLRRRGVIVLLVAVAALVVLVVSAGPFLARFVARQQTVEAPTTATGELPSGATLLRALGDPATSGLAAWPGLFDAAPKAYDLNGDGTDELIALNNDTNVYVFDAATGRALAVLPTTYPPGWYIEGILNGVEAGVLRPGEPPSLVVTDHAAYVSVWQFVPQQSNAEHFQFELKWENRMDWCFWNPGMDAKPTLVDLDGNGTLDILVQTEEEGLFALGPDGSLLWQKCWAGGNSAPIAADLDGDGRPEAIFASDSGYVSVLAGATGEPLWTFDARQHGITPASISVSPTVAELDGAAPQEILFTARHAPSNDPATFSKDHMAIFAVHENLQTGQPEILWMRQPDWAHPLSYTQLRVEDVDGDGSPDIFGMDWNTIGHFPGNWENLGAAHLFRLNARGDAVWVHDLEAWWSNKDIALADSDGDGKTDLLVEGPRLGLDGLWRLSPDDGKPIGFLPAGASPMDGAPAWKLMRGPTLVDLRHNGSLQLAYPVAPDEAQPARGAILVFDLALPNVAPWS